MTEAETFCFILGRGRSGTSLLASALNANPAISVAPESLFIMNTRNKYSGKTWDKATVRGFFEDLWLEPRMQAWNLDREGLLEWLLQRSVGTEFSHACKIVYSRYAHDQGKPGAMCLGDKNPHYALFVKEILHLFPGAKFIHLIRDYRDNIASYQRVKFDCQDAAALAYRWKIYNQLVCAAAKQIPGQFLTVRYEDLVSDPDNILGGICEYLGVSFRREMLDFYKGGGRTAVEWHKNLSGPFNTRSVNRWSESLTPRDLALAEDICGEFAKEYGYELSGNSAGRHGFRKIKGVVVGWLVTKLEKILFTFPISFRSHIIMGYRKMTGSHRLTGGQVN